MTPHTILDEIAIKPYAVLKALRLEMKYSIGEMALLLGIPKATYQGYETGRRPMPVDLIDRVKVWRQKDLDFMAGIGESIDAWLKEDGFENGIPSGPIESEENSCDPDNL